MVNVPSADQQYINQDAAATGLPVSVVAAQVSLESGFRTNAVSSAGALGPYQFLPSTYVGLGFPAGTESNWAESSLAYQKYMKQLLAQENGSVFKALEAYNAGPGNLAAGAGYANSILSAAGQGVNITAGGGSSANTTGILSDLNPAHWASALEQDVVINPVKKVWNWMLNALGVKSLTDLLERGALIVFGTILVILGLHSFVKNTNTGSKARDVAENAIPEAEDVAVAE